MILALQMQILVSWWACKVVFVARSTVSVGLFSLPPAGKSFEPTDVRNFVDQPSVEDIWPLLWRRERKSPPAGWTSPVPPASRLVKLVRSR